MASYWSGFASAALATAADVGGDMLPVVALIAGIVLGERLLRFVLSVARG